MPKESEAWDFIDNPVLEGVFESKKEHVGPNNSSLYTFRVEDQLVAVWGNTVLDARLEELNSGAKVKIEYLGKSVSPKTKREYKNFEVSVWEEPLPY